MQKHKWVIVILLYSVGLVSCASQTTPAPVVEAWAQTTEKLSDYRVKQGDTLYSIAWSLGLDYRVLAKANHLSPPYSIHPGQTIKTSLTKEKHQLPPSREPTYLTMTPKIQTQNWTSPHWIKPARGVVIQAFSNKPLGNKGIDIAGKLGEPVLAAADGEVVYSGAGVRGYGNLIIIKHNASFLSAYAFNQQLLVNVGQRIHCGQKIALMGRNNAGKVMIHFEIRKNGKPVNPRLYL